MMTNRASNKGISSTEEVKEGNKRSSKKLSVLHIIEFNGNFKRVSCSVILNDYGFTHLSIHSAV